MFLVNLGTKTTRGVSWLTNYLSRNLVMLIILVQFLSKYLHALKPFSTGLTHSTTCLRYNMVPVFVLDARIPYGGDYSMPWGI